VATIRGLTTSPEFLTIVRDGPGAHASLMGDEKELEAARSGDPRAFERLVEKHTPAVYRIAASIAGQADAEDVAQEVFVRLHQGLADFRGDATLSTWLHRVTVNTALTNRTRRRRRETGRVSAEAALDHEDQGARPDGALLAEEEKGAVRRALDELPEEFRSVVVLREIEGLPFEEVARVLGIKKPTAESRMARARERLRKLLGGKSDV
jgi:RNA polymerase sigma-70 factor (ECF subfamily)